MQEIFEINHLRVDRKQRKRVKYQKWKRSISKPQIPINNLNRTVETNDDRSIAVVIPAHNEERFIGSLVIQTLQFTERVIVVDDGSEDHTAAVARAAGADVIIHDRNQGKGVAMENGLAYALSLNVDAIVVMDGDGQHRPQEIPDLVHPILEGKADMVIGSRFREVKSEIPWWRQIGQHALTMATNTASRVHSTDSQSGFRAFSRSAVESMDLRSTGFSVESELQFLAGEKQWRVVEAPISVVYKEKAKRNPIQQGLQVLNGIMKLVSESRPLFFFGGSGVIVTLLGVFWWGLIVDIYAHSGVLAIGYASLATLMIILGVLSLFQGITLQTLKGIAKMIHQGRNNIVEASYRVEAGMKPVEKTALESEMDDVSSQR
jgi:glycosyltransferase involved in cell wall biosynthesis